MQFIRHKDITSAPGGILLICRYLEFRKVHQKNAITCLIDFYVPPRASATGCCQGRRWGGPLVCPRVEGPVMPEGYLELDFLGADELAFNFSILVCATHSLSGVPCTVGKPVRRAFGVPLERTARVSACPWLIPPGNEPATGSPQRSTSICGSVCGCTVAKMCPCRGGRTDSAPPRPQQHPMVALD